MILNVYAIRDDKSEAYMQPWFAPTNGAAIRNFSDAVNQNDSPFAKHPEDYVLFHIGQYDDSRGVIIPLDAPKSLGVAVEFKESANG